MRKLKFREVKRTSKNTNRTEQRAPGSLPTPSGFVCVSHWKGMEEYIHFLVGSVVEKLGSIISPLRISTNCVLPTWFWNSFYLLREEQWEGRMEGKRKEGIKNSGQHRFHLPWDFSGRLDCRSISRGKMICPVPLFVDIPWGSPHLLLLDYSPLTLFFCIPGKPHLLDISPCSQ